MGFSRFSIIGFGTLVYIDFWLRLQGFKVSGLELGPNVQCNVRAPGR